MINSAPPPAASSASAEDPIDAIVRSGPRGAVVVSGIATAIVIALWFAFYLFVFSPRGAVQ